MLRQGFYFKPKRFPLAELLNRGAIYPIYFRPMCTAYCYLQAHVIGNMASLEIISRRQLLGGAQSSSRTEEPRNSFVPRLP